MHELKKSQSVAVFIAAMLLVKAILTNFKFNYFLR